MASRTWAVGDIHGQLRQFDALLHRIEITPDDQLILLGDLIDRGPESAGVLKRAIALADNCNLSIIRGNHEQMMLAARDSHAAFGDWMQNGGDTTLRSYAGARATLRDVHLDHWHFLSSRLSDFIETDTHIFVHANAYSDLPMPEQPGYMLRWQRCDTLVAHQSRKTIVCGHTPQESGRPKNVGHGICIDTNAFAGGPLTALHIESGQILQAMTDIRVVQSHISDYQEG